MTKQKKNKNKNLKNAYLNKNENYFKINKKILFMKKR